MPPITCFQLVYRRIREAVQRIRHNKTVIGTKKRPGGRPGRMLSLLSDNANNLDISIRVECGGIVCGPGGKDTVFEFPIKHPFCINHDFIPHFHWMSRGGLVRI